MVNVFGKSLADRILDETATGLSISKIVIYQKIGFKFYRKEYQLRKDYYYNRIIKTSAHPEYDSLTDNLLISFITTTPLDFDTNELDLINLNKKLELNRNTSYVSTVVNKYHYAATTFIMKMPRHAFLDPNASLIKSFSCKDLYRYFDPCAEACQMVEKKDGVCCAIGKTYQDHFSHLFNPLIAKKMTEVNGRLCVVTIKIIQNRNESFYRKEYAFDDSTYYNRLVRTTLDEKFDMGTDNLIFATTSTQSFDPDCDMMPLAQTYWELQAYKEKTEAESSFLDWYHRESEKYRKDPENYKKNSEGFNRRIDIRNDE